MLFWGWLKQSSPSPPTPAALAERKSLRLVSLYSLATFEGNADNLARTACDTLKQSIHPFYRQAGT
jgi:hypothetical protein